MEGALRMDNPLQNGLQAHKCPSADRRWQNEAQRWWNHLRTHLRRAVTKMKEEDLRPVTLTHGLKLLRNLSFPARLKHVQHIAAQRRLMSLDSSGCLRSHYEDGRVCSSVDFTWPVSGLLYACQAQVYVAWGRQELLLFDKCFALLSQSAVEQGVLCCVYDPRRNLVLCGGCGGVNAWTFGHSRRSLVWQRWLSQGINAEDEAAAITTSADTCYAACGMSVWEYDLCDGALQRVRRHLHTGTITGLVYADCLNLLISGSRDGTIKVWDREAQLTAVYVGHTGPVTALSLSTTQMILLSGSSDGTLRIWDLSTQEQIGEHQMPGPLLGVEAFSSNGEHVVSYSNHGVHVWQVQSLYLVHCLLGTRVREMTVSGGYLPSRALCVCADSTVRLISATTGDLLSTLLLDRGERLLAADYCMHREAVCLLLEGGDLVKANALVNPMSIISRVKVSHSEAAPCCLTLVSFIVDVAAAVAEWKRVVHQRGDHGPHDKAMKNRFFPVVGFDDGALSVLDWYTSRPLSQTAAHSPGKVSAVISDAKNNYIISAGSDLTVKVWRFFPYSEESLSLCMTFYCSQHVGKMCLFRSKLFVAFQDSPMATFSLVQYCLQSEARSDHPPGDDHQDQVTGLCSCPKLRLVATCGRDRRVRIWSEENRLLRTLSLHGVPESLAFSGDRGELLVGLSSHIYRISLGRLLPLPYQLKVLCMESPSTAADPPVPVLETDLLSLSMEDRKRLAQPHCMLPRPSVDIFSNGKTGPGLGEIDQIQEWSLLSARNQELYLIRDGKLRPCVRRKRNKETKREAMKKYLQLFYRERPPIMIPEQDYFNPDELLMPPVKREETPPSDPLNANRGFFTDCAAGLSLHPQASCLSLGAVANSAVLRRIWPMEMPEKRQPGTGMNKLRLTLREENLTFENIPDTDHVKDVTGEEEEEAAEESEESDEVPAILQKIWATESPPASDTGSVAHLSPPPVIKTSSAPVPKRPIVSRIPRHRPPVTQSSSRSPIVVRPPSAEPRSPPLPDVSQKPTAPSPDAQRAEQPEEVPEVPAFILQFQERSWFSSILPDVQTGHSEFQSGLLQGVLQADDPVRIQLLQALQTLHRQGHLSDPQKVFHTLREAINTMTGEQASGDGEFLWYLLRFMNDLSPGSSELVLELLVTCVLVDPAYREKYLALFGELGVQDPHGFIGKKCGSWDSWERAEKSRETLKQTCEDWMRRWTLRLMEYLEAAVTQNIGPRTSQVSIGMKFPAIVRRQERVGAGRGKQLPGSLAIDVTAIDVLNYYCEVQMKKEMQEMSDSGPEHGSTVLALPPIYRKRALLRLGETGTRVRHREQEGGGLPPITQPLLPSIIPFINLPVKKVTLRPFTPAPDCASSLALDCHRYFILQQSRVDSYPGVSAD